MATAPAATTRYRRRRPSRREAKIRLAATNPDLTLGELCRRDIRVLMREFWDEVAADKTLHWNFHIDVMAEHLMKVMQRVAAGLPKEYDTVINVPPGSTKSLTCSVMLPVWGWLNWPWLQYICGSYAMDLSLDLATRTRDMMRGEKFKRCFPGIDIKEDQDTKSNFRIVYRDRNGREVVGGNRFACSVGGRVTGFHGHVLIVDDPLNPKEAVSEVGLKTANDWMERTLSTRKVEKSVAPTILVMQRLHEDDPSGRALSNEKRKVYHICLPAELGEYAQYVRPVELIEQYQDGLLDPVRHPRSVLEEYEAGPDGGQYFYASQFGQHPVPPGQGMFKVDMFQIADRPPGQVLMTIRYWDKAATQDGGAYTVGVKMVLSMVVGGNEWKNYRFTVADVKRGQWSTEVREAVIRATAEADGRNCVVHVEQEPGSGGKESAESTVRNLAGYPAYKDRPIGDKVYRADPYSVAVNNGSVCLLRADWNKQFKDEHALFPFGKYKDQVDAAAGAYAKCSRKKIARRVN